MIVNENTQVGALRKHGIGFEKQLINWKLVLCCTLRERGKLLKMLGEEIHHRSLKVIFENVFVVL